MKVDNRLTSHRIRLVTAALADGPLCVHDMAPKVFLCYGQTWQLLKFMHKQRLVHIAKWPWRGTRRIYRVAAYAAGPGKDAKKPAPMTVAQRGAAYKARLRADDERYDLYKAKDRAQHRRPKRDPLVAAMFGAPIHVEVRHGR